MGSLGAPKLVALLGQLLTVVQFAFYILGIVCFIKYLRTRR